MHHTRPRSHCFSGTTRRRRRERVVVYRPSANIGCSRSSLALRGRYIEIIVHLVIAVGEVDFYVLPLPIRLTLRHAAATALSKWSHVLLMLLGTIEAQHMESLYRREEPSQYTEVSLKHHAYFKVQGPETVLTELPRRHVQTRRKAGEEYQSRVAFISIHCNHAFGKSLVSCLTFFYPKRSNTLYATLNR